MLTPKQIRIFGAFLKKPFKEFTYKEIKEHSNEKSNSIIQKAISQFLKDDLIKKKEIGNIILYTANLENELVYSYFDILTNEKLSKAAKASINIIKKELKEINFISIVIFGSFAKGQEKEKSDLDIAVFVNSDEDKKKCKSSLKSAELKSILKMDYYVFTKEELLLMLKDKQENLGKQIVMGHLAVYNPAIFYNIILEGIDNGLKIIY